MKTWVKVLIVTIVVGAVAFVTEPNGPLGGFWEPNDAVEDPEGVQIPLFILLGLAEAVMFGLGIAFIIFGYSWVRAVGGLTAGWSALTFASIAWMLTNWWSHDSLHIHNGLDLNGLLAIEYAFHITLMAAGLVVAYFFLAVVRNAGATAAAE